MVDVEVLQEGQSSLVGVEVLPEVPLPMAGQKNEITEIKQNMANLDIQLKQSIANVDTQLKASVTAMQKHMLMMMENMQEISDWLLAKPPPQHEHPPHEETPVANPNLAALLAKISKLEEFV